MEFWKQYDISDCFLHFYGAGCLREENQRKMEHFLQSLGFLSILVESDLFAAVRVVGDEGEMVAICGTGSVLFKVEHGQLIELRGGLGWEQGDEGGGFYFGKLLLERLNTIGNNYSEIRDLIEKWKPLDELYSIQGMPESKSIYSKLSFVLVDYQSHPLISSVHIENIQLFLERYASECTTIGFVGSYAFYMRDYFEIACKKRNIKAFSFIERPIDILSKELLL
jgi:hypothetical protein